MKEISLIIGSGFSVPDGMKTVGQLNKTISTIEGKDFYIHSDMDLILLNGQKKPNYVYNRFDEMFFVKFIKWYTEQNNGDFDYERFFDFVISFFKYRKHKKEMNTFFTQFKSDIIEDIPQLNGKSKEKYRPEDVLIVNSIINDQFQNLDYYLSRFVEYFHKLISILLQTQKYYNDVSLGNYLHYDGFLAFLKELVKDNFVVHVHSLNHDLLFEHLGSRHVDLWQHFTDGYSDLGSSYYGIVHLEQSISKEYKVRLKRFIDNYDKPIRLYKLHGSVDTYIANVASPNADLTRVKRDWGVGQIQKEIRDSNGKLQYTSLYQHTYPDILSGASSKAVWYKQPYYKELQNHFKRNLENSDLLLIIGYGFRDDGINNIIESNYLISGKQMTIIDIAEPSNRLFEDYNTTLIQKSLASVTYEDWIEIKKSCSI